MISGTPTVAGTYTLRYRATGGDGGTTDTIFDITVSESTVASTPYMLYAATDDDLFRIDADSPSSTVSPFGVRESLPATYSTGTSVIVDLANDGDGDIWVANDQSPSTAPRRVGKLLHARPEQTTDGYGTLDKFDPCQFGCSGIGLD